MPPLSIGFLRISLIMPSDRGGFFRDRVQVQILFTRHYSLYDIMSHTENHVEMTPAVYGWVVNGYQQLD